MKIVVYYPVPSLNKLFAMNPWQRRKEKMETQTKFLAALESQAIAADFSTSIISQGDASIFAIAARTLALYRVIHQNKSRLKSLKSKSPRKQRRGPK